MRDKDSCFDVAVVGGGPAGAACAARLARDGMRVTMLERSAYKTVRIGEVLPPSIRTVLDELGAWERFVAAGHVPVPAIASAWGSSTIGLNEFYFNPYGNGWHSDRMRFDAMLAEVAAEAGAVVRRQTTVARCNPHPRGGWNLQATGSGNCSSCLRAEIIVHATGRQNLQGIGCAQRLHFDRLIGIVRFFQAANAKETRTLIEAVESGWWYSALLPGGRCVATYMTDADLVTTSLGAATLVYDSALAAAPHTQNRLREAVPLGGTKVISANTYCRENATGRNWVAVGDAAFTFDPLSSQGIYKAMWSGLEAAKAVRDSWHGSLDALTNFARIAREEFARYLDERAAYYGREWRWPRSPFWRRRHESQGIGDNLTPAPIAENP